MTFRSKQTGEGSRTALPVVGAFLLRVQDRLPDVAFPPPPGRYQALDIDPDGDSLLVDEPDVADVTPDDYEWAFGEDPYEPAPTEAPEVVRPVEEKPDLRQPPPSSRRIGWGGDGQRTDPPTEAPTPTPRNPNNRGGMTAEEMIERAKEDG